MAITCIAIATVTVGSGGAANMEFTNIPATYTDLLLKYTARNASSSSNEGIYVAFNGSTSNFAARYLDNGGYNAPRSGAVARYAGVEVSNTQTTSTFANNEMYIPNYGGSNYKSYSVDSVTENNGNTAFLTFVAGLWSDTSAITSITLTLGASQNFAQYSTATLYGIKNTV